MANPRHDANLLADAIKRIHFNESVSRLWPACTRDIVIVGTSA